MPSYNNFDGTKWVSVASAAGVTDGAEAQPGERGERFVFLQADADAVSLITGQATLVASRAIDAGDWDIFGSIRTLGSSTSIADIQFWVTDVPGVVPPPQTFAFSRFNLGTQGQSGADTGFQLTCGPAQFNVSIPTKVYLGCLIAFASGTVQAAGSLCGRRMR